MGCGELVEYVRCVCVWLGAAWVERGGGVRGLGLDFTYHVGTGKCWTCVCVFVAVVCGGEWVGGLDHGLEGWGGVMYV